MNTKEPILNVRNLNKSFITKHGVHQAVNNVSFKVDKGEIMGLIGQSGSGKSTIANALVRTLKGANGVVTLNGEVVSGRLSRKKEKSFYRNVQMIYQDPHTALNEKRNVFSTIAEPLLTHKVIAKEAKEFLRLEKDVMLSWQLTLDMMFHKKEFETKNFIVKKRIEALDKIIAGLEAYEVQLGLDDEAAEVAYNTLVSLYFDDVLVSKNECLTKTIESVDLLLDFYNEASARVVKRQLSQDEIDLINAKQELKDYVESFDDNKIIEKIKLANIESSKEIEAQKTETKKIITAFIKDKSASIKSVRTMKQISKTIDEFETQKLLIWKLILQKDALKHLVAKNFALPKEVLYEFDAKLSELSHQNEVNALVAQYEELFANQTNEFILTANNEKEKVITKLQERLGNEKVADSEQVALLTNKVSEAQKVYDQEKEKALVNFKAFNEQLAQSKKDAAHEEKDHHIHALRAKAKHLFNQKANLALSQIKDKNTLKTKKQQLEQKFTRIAAFDIEEKQILKSLEMVRIIYQIKKTSKPIRYFTVKKLLLQRKVINALVQVGLKPEHAYRYPHEFSGGQKQRINIARALILEPELIIADEPIASLDISIQAQVINILIDLVKKKGISMIFIGHDLSVIEYLADSILVMHLGRVVEKGHAGQIFKNPLHPYTKTLFASIPKVSTANEPFKAANVDLTYIAEYIQDKPSYKIVAPHHLLLANDVQLKRWANKSSADEYSTDVYKGEKVKSKVAETIEESIGEELVTKEIQVKKTAKKTKPKSKADAK